MAHIEEGKRVAAITFTVAEDVRVYRTYDVDPCALDADEYEAIMQLVEREDISDEDDALTLETLERVTSKYQFVLDEHMSEADEPNVNYMLGEIYYEED